MMSTSDPICDEHAFTDFCLNPIAFNIKDTTLYAQSTEADFCPSDPYAFTIKGMLTPRQFRLVLCDKNQLKKAIDLQATLPPSNSTMIRTSSCHRAITST